jgi:histidyl-tRNA synthetase
VAEIVQINVPLTLEKIAAITAVEKLDDLPDDVRLNGPINALAELLAALEKRGISNVKYDPMLMRGFDYYTGIVFEVFDNNPANNRAMFGGGRYDGLVGLFGVEDLPVVGVAPGELTTLNFLKAWNLLPDLRPATDIYVVPLGIAADEIADKLRAGGLNVALDFGDRKLEKAIKTAVKLGVPYILFAGQNEQKTGKYNLKNLATQEEKQLTIDEIIAELAAS